MDLSLYFNCIKRKFPYYSSENRGKYAVKGERLNTDMKLQKVLVEKLKPTKYNPRKDLKPGDPAYKKIKRSMTTYGYVDSVIWNEVTDNIAGGHQRYKVLVAEGVKEIGCMVVHIENPQDEKALRTLPPIKWSVNGNPRHWRICCPTFSFPDMTSARPALTQPRWTICFQ